MEPEWINKDLSSILDHGDIFSGQYQGAITTRLYLLKWRSRSLNLSLHFSGVDDRMIRR